MSNVYCDCGSIVKVDGGCGCNCNPKGVGNLTKEQFFDLLDEWWMYKCMKESGFTRKETDMIKKRQGAYARESNRYAKELKRMKYNKEQDEFYEADKREYEKFVKENNVRDVIGEEEKAKEEARLKVEKEKQQREERNKTFKGKVINFLDDFSKEIEEDKKRKEKESKLRDIMYEHERLEALNKFTL